MEEIDNGTLDPNQITTEYYRKFLSEELLKSIDEDPQTGLRKYQLIAPSWCKELWICFRDNECWLEFIPIKPVEYINLSFRATKSGIVINE